MNAEIDVILCPNGIVSLSDGKAYSVYFIDSIRLQQDLDSEVELGSLFLAPPGLIAIPELSRSAIENAIALSTSSKLSQFQEK